MSLERGGRTNEAKEKNDRKKTSIQSSENLETWKPEPGDVHVQYVARLIRPNTTRVERGIRRGRGKENTVALLQRETGGIKK